MWWIRDKIVPQVKEKQTKEEIAEAKKHAAKEGTRSVFDVRPTVVKKPVVEGRSYVLTQLKNREKIVKAKEVSCIFFWIQVSNFDKFTAQILDGQLQDLA
jgi:hypothetical protein